MPHLDREAEVRHVCQHGHTRPTGRTGQMPQEAAMSRSTRRTQSTQTAPEAQATQEPQEGQEPQTGQTAETGQTGQPEAEATEATQPTPEELLAEVERLRQELEAAKAKTARKPRVKRPSPKQQRLMAYLREHPDASIGEACKEAGATETSHGLVFRMIEDGYLRVSVPEPEAEVEGDEPDTEGAPTEEQTEETAETSAA